MATTLYGGTLYGPSDGADEVPHVYVLQMCKCRWDASQLDRTCRYARPRQRDHGTQPVGGRMTV
eukprot:scaffold7308_cov114-Isochrysis_galbana.AAC.15